MDGGDEGQRGGQRQAGDHPSFPVKPSSTFTRRHLIANHEWLSDLGH